VNSRIVSQDYRTIDEWEEDGEDHQSSRIMPSQGSGLTRYVEPLFIYKRWLLGWCIVSCFLCWVALLIWPRTYESECKLQCNVGRETVGLDPTTTTTQTLMLQKTQEEDVNSALELLGSKGLADNVVAELGAENILSGYLPTLTEVSPTYFDKLSSGISNWASNAVDTILNGSGIRDKISDAERAAIRVQKDVSISSPKKSTALIVQAKAKSPQMAQAIVKSLTAHFLTKHVNVTTTEGSLDFFSTHAGDAEDKVNRLLDRRSKMLQFHQIASTESKNNALTTQVAAIETTILNTQAQIKRTDSEINDIGMRMQELEMEVISSRQTSSDLGVSGMRSQLYALELEEKRRSALYTNDHPLLVQIRGQNAAGTEVLEKLKRENESQSTTPNPLRRTLEQDLLKAQTAAVGLNALLKESSAQKEIKEREIRELLDFEVELSEVNREIEVAKSSLISLRDKQEQARVVDSLRNKKISSIAISQAASFAEKPSDPKKVLVIAGFTMIGLVGGLGLVGLNEYSRTTIRRPDEAERLLRYPVLATVLENKALKQDSLNLKRRTYKTLKSKKMQDIHDGCRSIMSELYLGEAPTDVAEVFLGRTIGIVGVRDDCGASSVAMMLALESSGHEGLRTTLVDLDLRKRTVSKVFGLVGPTSQPGTELATGAASSVDFLQSLTEESLGLVGTGTRSVSRRIDVNAQGVTALLQDLARNNDFVIVDLPPANRPSNLMQIVRHLDQIIVVVESERTESQAAERLVARFEKMNVEVVGIVVNKYRKRVPSWLQKLLG
jgi:polysaccharide biosynthesis transport protein